MSAIVGYVVLAKRPDNRATGSTHDTAGSIHPTIEPVERHRDWCEDNAAEDPERYGGVQYVIGEIREVLA
jgi:hypothetical protein